MTVRPTAPGDIADGLAALDQRIRVRHRAAKQGLGRAYLDGFGIALEGGASVVVQMDADFSHDPGDLAGRSSGPSSTVPPTSSSARATRRAVAWSTGDSGAG